MSSSANISRRCSSSSSSSSSSSTRRRRSALASKPSRRSRQGKRTGGSSSAAVSEKLESLRSLIPACGGDRAGDEASAPAPATERLFQETADYILRLRAQVVVLQGLIQLYSPENDTVSSAVV